MSIVVLDDVNKVQVCCEALILRESLSVYKFMLESCFEMAPSVKHTDIHCIFSDEFLTVGFLEEMNLQHASLFLDHYHLDLNFKKKLHPTLYNKARNYLNNILLSPSEKLFDDRIKLLVDNCEGELAIK